MWRALRIGLLSLVLLIVAGQEIMAVKTPLSPTEAQLPDGLEDERVGPVTAREIGWVRH